MIGLLSKSLLRLLLAFALIASFTGPLILTPIPHPARADESEVALTITPLTSPEIDPTTGALSAAPEVVRDGAFGIAHVGYGDGTTPGDIAGRYSNAAALGAKLDRWVIYWSDVERSTGYYDYSRADEALARDRAYGFSSNVVLLGTPGQYATAGSTSVDLPRVEDKSRQRAYLTEGERSLAPESISAASSPPSGLYNPIFDDGTDIPGPNKKINGGNPWAKFVNTTFARYSGQVSVYEIWNEADFSAFWTGSLRDYHRLLKVAYFAGKSADPNARIAVAGQMYWEWANRDGQHAWLKAFLVQVGSDARANQYGFFFDIMPYHWYSRPADIYTKTVEARQILAGYGLQNKPIWVNETNSPACGEPPGYVSCAGFDYPGGATAEEQAAGMLQSLAYARAANLGAILAFQLADDGHGQSFGLYRGAGDSPRPVATAYSVGAQFLRGAIATVRAPIDSNYERIVTKVNHEGTIRYVTTVWKKTPGDGVARLPASGGANLIAQDGSTSVINSSGGALWVSLPGATDFRNFNNNPNDYIIGGKTYLVVSDWQPPDVSFGGVPPPTPTPTRVPPTPTKTPAPTPTPGPLQTGMVRNGDFEAGTDCVPNMNGDPVGPDGWECLGDTPARLTNTALHGKRALALGQGFVQNPFAGPGSSSAVSQTIAIPANVKEARLAFSYLLTTSEPEGGSTDPDLWPDRFEITLRDPNGVTYRPFVTRSATSGFKSQVVDLTPFIGKSVTLTLNVFQSTPDNPTTVFVDALSGWTNWLHFALISAWGRNQ